ncbi:MAG: GNAT family N-acetyltransferase [Pseudomonadota bacterium]
MKQDVIIAAEAVKGPRFALRPVRTSDAGLMALYTADRRVADMTRSIPHPLPPGSAEAFIERVSTPASSERVWVMDASAFGGSELLGVVSLTQMDRNQAEIGYWIAPAMWNTGLASEAVRLLVEANPLGYATIFGSVFQDNPASARVLTNAGFAYLGDAEAFSVARGAKASTWTYLKQLD